MPRYHPALSSLDTPLGRKVRAKAIRDDLTLVEVCAKLKLNRSTLHRVMTGKFVAGDAKARIEAWLTRSE